jgi:hypothetical protein
LIIGGVALLGCVGCGVLFGIGIAGGLFYTQSVAATGDAFMTALRDSNYTQAYNLCTPELQRELRSAQDLERSARSNNVRPTSWNFTSRNIEGDEGRLEGTAQLEDGREATVRLALDRVGDDWKVSGFQIRPS